jgi:hypothetical protein
LTLKISYSVRASYVCQGEKLEGWYGMDKKQEEGAAVGLAIGAGIGLAIGTILGNVALWMPIGAVLGLIFGGGLTVKRKNK